jgi:hypothetical protein
VAEKVTYYAIVDEFSSHAVPGGVIRRVESGDGLTDEAFSADLKWEFSPLLAAAERGDTMFDLVPITEVEAQQIVERIKETATSAE